MNLNVKFAEIYSVTDLSIVRCMTNKVMSTHIYPPINELRKKLASPMLLGIMNSGGKQFQMGGHIT